MSGTNSAPVTPNARGHFTLWTRRRIALAILFLAVTVFGAWRYRITRPDYCLTRGQEALREGDWDTVVRFANRLESGGHTDHAALLRAESLRTRHRPDLALTLLAKMRPDGPLRLQAWALSGRCLLDLGKLQDAHDTLAAVVAEQPNHADAHRGLAVIAYDLGQLSEAVEHLQKVAELDPVDARPHRLIGLIHKDMAQHGPSEEAYREAMRRGLPAETNQKVRGELAEVLLRRGKFAEALTLLEGSEGSDDPERIAIRAACLRGLGRTREAADELDRSLAKHQTSPLFRLRGQVHQDQGHVEEALQCFVRAVELGPTDHQAHYLLGQAYAAVGRKVEATQAFARDAELRKELDLLTDLSKEAMVKPWDPGVRLQLAEVCDRMSKPELAAMWRKAAAACSGANP